MRTLRTQALSLLLIVIAQFAFAGDASIKPASPFSSHLTKQIRNIDGLLTKNAALAPASAKICSCQILAMKSNNYDHQNLVVFAEKTNHGDFSAGAQTADKAIEREKRHIRDLFYDKIKVLDRVTEATDCQSLYKKLKAADQTLVMYDVLNADINK